MLETDFATSLLETEVIVYTYRRWPRLSLPDLVERHSHLQWGRIESNPEAKREARRSLFDAHNAPERR
jgi:hypothetical protein